MSLIIFSFETQNFPSVTACVAMDHHMVYVSCDITDGESFVLARVAVVVMVSLA